MLRLTRTGKIFVALIVVMHFASITSQSGLLIWLVGLLGGCLAVNGYAALRSIRNVRLRAPNRILIEEGSPSREPWQLINTGKRPARLVTVEAADQTWLQSALIPPGETVAAAPRDVFKKRGVYSGAEAWIVSLYPFGLIKAMRDAECDCEVLVFPRLYHTAAPEVRGLDPMVGGRHIGPGRIQSGENFAGVRPVQPGDSFKQIHWKSSSKGGGLMVKTFEEELAGRAALLVYCDPASADAEACLRAAGSLALAGVEAGHQIEFHNAMEKRRLRIPPFGDTTRLLEELARFGSSKPVNPNSAEAFANIPPRSAVHFVATALTPQIKAEVEKLRAQQKLVVLHLPRSQAGPETEDGIVHFYATE